MTTNTNNNNHPTFIKQGFLDHGSEKCCFLPLQRPRHHRVCLSVLAFSFIVSAVGIFFSAVVSIAFMDAEPAWHRIHHPSFPNDAAIFFLPGDDGKLEYRECSGSVLWTCNDCDDDSSASFSKTEDADVGSKLNDSSSSSLFGGGGDSSTRKYENTSGHPNDCPCGSTEYWNLCPKVPNGVSSSSHLDCRKVEQRTEELYPFLILWIALGMGLNGVAWAAVLPAACCMGGKNMRYKRPIVAFISLAIVGVIIPLVLSILVGQALEKSKFATDDQSMLCNDGQLLLDKGFKTLSILGVHRSTIAGLVFAAGTCIYFALGLLYVMLAPRPAQGTCCYIGPYRPEPDCCCCCDDDDFGGEAKCCGVYCTCCECCDSPDDEDDCCCCICFNDWEDVNHADFINTTGTTTAPTTFSHPNNNNNNDNVIPNQNLDNVELGIVVGGHTNFDGNGSYPSDNNNHHRTSAWVNHNYPGHYSNSTSQHHHRHPHRRDNEEDNVSVNSDDNPDFFAANANAIPNQQQPVAGIPIFGSANTTH